MLGGAGAHPLEVAQGGAGVEQRVGAAAVAFEEEGDVEAGPPGAVGVAAGLLVGDGLLVVAQGLAGIPRHAVDVAELAVDCGEVFGVVGGEEGQGLLEVVQGGVEVGQEYRLGFPGVAGFVEPPVGEDARLARVLARPRVSLSARWVRLC